MRLPSLPLDLSWSYEFDATCNRLIESSDDDERHSLVFNKVA